MSSFQFSNIINCMKSSIWPHPSPPSSCFLKEMNMEIVLWGHYSAFGGCIFCFLLAGWTLEMCSWFHYRFCQMPKPLRKSSVKQRKCPQNIDKKRLQDSPHRSSFPLQSMQEYVIFIAMWREVRGLTPYTHSSKVMISGWVELRGKAATWRAYGQYL